MIYNREPPTRMNRLPRRFQNCAYSPIQVFLPQVRHHSAFVKRAHRYSWLRHKTGRSLAQVCSLYGNPRSLHGPGNEGLLDLLASSCRQRGVPFGKRLFGFGRSYRRSTSGRRRDTRSVRNAESRACDSSGGSCCLLRPPQVKLSVDYRHCVSIAKINPHNEASGTDLRSRHQGKGGYLDLITAAGRSLLPVRRVCDDRRNRRRTVRPRQLQIDCSKLRMDDGHMTAESLVQLSATFSENGFGVAGFANVQ